MLCVVLRLLRRDRLGFVLRLGLPDRDRLGFVLDLRLFVAELFANRIAAFFACDVIVAVIVLLVLLITDRESRRPESVRAG